MPSPNSGMIGNIMNMFNARGQEGGAGGNPQSPNPTPRQNPVTNNQPGGTGGIIPNNPQPNNTPQDPLAAFSKIFDNAPDANAPQRPEFKLSPDVLKQASESQDFSSLVPADFYDRLEKRDPTALSDLVNALGRKVYSTSLEHSSALTDRFVDLHSQYDRKGLGKQVTATLAKNNLKSISEKSPVAAKQIEQIQSAVLEANPDATPEFIQQQTEEYFRQIALVMFPDLAKMNPNGKKQDSNQPGGGTNWDSWFNK